MPKSIEPPERQANIIRIRSAFFSREFWQMWEQLTDLEKDAYILGWISELEMAIRRLSEQIQRINEYLEDDRKWSRS